MATATKTHPDAVKRTAPRTKPPEPGALDYLQRALEDLNQARTHAQKDVKDNIDDAAERVRAAAEDVRKRLRDEGDELQKRLDAASEEVRIELGRAAIRAQQTPEALADLTREIRRQKESLKDEVA